MATVDYGEPRGSIFSVLADGKFHHTVTEETPGAVKREWESSDGQKSGVKWELLAQSITGLIANLGVYDGDYGKSILITFAGENKATGDTLTDMANDDSVVVSLSAQSNFGEDFLKKLPNIDIDKPVKLVPYSFEDDKGKKKRGVTVYQDDVKLQSAYHKENAKTKKFNAVNGYPAIPKEAKDWDKDEWKLYFGQARIFLLGEIKKHALFNMERMKRVKEAKKLDEEYPGDDTPGSDPSAIEF